MMIATILLHITPLFALRNICKLLKALYNIRTMRPYQRFLITLIAVSFFLSLISIRDEHLKFHQTLDFLIEFGRVFLNTGKCALMINVLIRLIRCDNHSSLRGITSDLFDMDHNQLRYHLCYHCSNCSAARDGRDTSVDCHGYHYQYDCE